jgi:hypothetical protein
MKAKFTITVVVTLVFALTGGTAQAIEGGESAKNHPRVVSLYFQSVSPTSKYEGCSAFLFAPRIVVTQAHCLFSPETNKKLSPAKVFVGAPGKVINTRGPSFQVKKIFMPPGYKNTRTPEHSTKDIAILVTSKSISKVRPATPISKAAFDELVSSGGSVTVGGYGLSSAKERKMSSRNNFKFPRKLTVNLVQRDVVETYMKSSFARQQSLPEWLDLALIDKYGWVGTSPSLGATCDGDSGSGFFIENGKQAIFVGANGGPMGSPNCYKNGQWYSGGGLNKIIPIFMYSELLAAAIDYESKLK